MKNTSEPKISCGVGYHNSAEEAVRCGNHMETTTMCQYCGETIYEWFLNIYGYCPNCKETYYAHKPKFYKLRNTIHYWFL